MGKKFKKGGPKGKGKKGKKGKKKGRKGKKSKISIAPAPAVPVPCIPEPPKPRDPCSYLGEGGGKGSIACRPNHYPGLLDAPLPMAVVGSECGSYESLKKLLCAGFRCADRVLVMTPWGNYVVFSPKGEGSVVYFLFDGCTCNVNRFRFLDLNCGTAGLLYFETDHDVINYLIDSKKMHQDLKKIRKSVIDDICKEFCEYTSK